MSDESVPAAPSRATDEELINAADVEAHEWSATTPHATPTDASRFSSVDQPFPSYHVIRELHRGGQGVVYLAVHERTKRKVAIKAMRDGPFAGPRERGRFEREMQILAQLNDPRIVQIHDSNTIAGSTYYVMDYISGHSLDHYLKGPKRPVKEVLSLFLRICDAVHAAHLRGVIHRDLKPGNIRIDTLGEPHILDFGLAKVALTDPGTDNLSLTGEFVGSLPWASPEQAEGQSSKIDMRTDVYSLGVILYQMLTGGFPYAVQGTMRAVLDTIMHTEPTRPKSIRREIGDEAETIVLKCLSKDRDRRYQTAGELARDIRHYLAGETIEAKRDSHAYVLKKMIVRNKFPVGVAAAFLVMLATAGVTIFVFHEEAKAQTQSAIVGRSTTHAVLEVFDEVTRSDPAGLDGALDKLAAQYGTVLRDEPAFVAQVFHSIGTVYYHLDRYSQAERLYRRALDIRLTVSPDPSEELAESKAFLATCLEKLEDWDSAINLHREAVDIRRRLYAEPHEEIARSLNNLARCFRDHGDFENARDYFRQALDMFQELQTDAGALGAAKVLGSLGQSELDAGLCGQARPLLEQSYADKLTLPRSTRHDRDSIGNAEHQLARLLFRCEPRDLIRAKALCGKALAHRQHAQPATHFHAESLLLMAEINEAGGDIERAIGHAHAAIEASCHIEGAHHETVDRAAKLLANLYERNGRPDLAADYRDPSAPYCQPMNR